MLDLEPATRAFSDLLAGVRDDQLADPTPCARACLGDLIDHVDGVSIAFCAAPGRYRSLRVPNPPRPMWPDSTPTGDRRSPSGSLA